MSNKKITISYKDRKPGKPGVILLDLKMPRMDGFEFLTIVKNDKNLKMIPVVVLTSSREENDLIRGYELGVNAYVVKPVNFQTFTDAIKAIGGFWAFLNELPPERS